MGSACLQVTRLAAWRGVGQDFPRVWEMQQGVGEEGHEPRSHEPMASVF